MSLADLSKLYCTTHYKDEVDHNAINIDNWESEVERQGLHQYMKLDVLALEEAFNNYDELIFKDTGISIKAENILSTSSLT